MKKLNTFVILILITMVFSSSMASQEVHQTLNHNNQANSEIEGEPETGNVQLNSQTLNQVSEPDSTKKEEDEKEIIKESDLKKVPGKLDLDDENEEQGTSILSFNFIHYILSKFKFSDILGNGY